jgi:DNA polymerase elongation subunit (family B)
LNSGSDGRMLSQQSTEAGLLNYLLGRLEKLDADVYCGHNIAAFDMDVLLHRLQHHKVALFSGSQLSKLQLKRGVYCGKLPFGFVHICWTPVCAKHILPIAEQSRPSCCHLYFEATTPDCLPTAGKFMLD